jgi:hypothetical protein
MEVIDRWNLTIYKQKLSEIIIEIKKIRVKANIWQRIWDNDWTDKIQNIII